MRASDPPRTRLVLRVIAIERSLRGLLLLAAGTYLLLHLSTDLGRLAERIMRSIDIDPRQHFLNPIVARLHRLHAHELRIAGLTRSATAPRASRGSWPVVRPALGRIPNPDRHLAADPLRALDSRSARASGRRPGCSSTC